MIDEWEEKVIKKRNERGCEWMFRSKQEVWESKWQIVYTLLFQVCEIVIIGLSTFFDLEKDITYAYIDFFTTSESEENQKESEKKIRTKARRKSNKKINCWLGSPRGEKLLRRQSWLFWPSVADDCCNYDQLGSVVSCNQFSRLFFRLSSVKW